eukprot:CAMPEP_0167753104 /NCGR_PEP_ID=MMETSP0110_2-20121227/7520_1 /TAXON_ID=629695 /ORGANISM="Gymnochlora sp., Strain CCMP2014" /LENGTH=446 /DNA_ID=CAMNT_0007638817 /DNA_START=24 /DNA_END=1364 /DNA_ORIENTATION=-
MGDEKDGIITALEFDETGDTLAVGGKTGHVTLYKKGEDGSYLPEFKFRSHAPTLDPLKSLEIEERINMIKFARGRSSGMYILTTNDKVVKLWRVQRKRSQAMRKLSSSPQRLKLLGRSPGSGSPPKLHPKAPSGLTTLPGVPPPKLRTNMGLQDEKKLRRSLKSEFKLAASLKRQYAGAHSYHIHSISINSDNETFISLDSLRINLWHLERDAQRFPIIDIKPKDMSSLTEIVTSGTFHPDQCNTLMYTTSRGRVCLHDLRSSAILKEPAKNFEIAETAYATKHFFSEVLVSISDAKFTDGGRYVLSRDYFSLKLWDVNMERKPVEVYPIQNHLASSLPLLYQNNALFDKFQCAASPDGKHFATGSYSNLMYIQSRKRPAIALSAATPSSFSLMKRTDPKVTQVSQLDLSGTKFNQKVLLSAWHPKKNIVASAATNRIDVYEAKMK